MSAKKITAAVGWDIRYTLGVAPPTADRGADETKLKLRHMDLWSAREDDPIVVDRALSWDHGTGDIGPGAIRVECSDWPSPIVVIGVTMDTDGNRDGVSDAKEAREIACNAALERGWVEQDDTGMCPNCGSTLTDETCDPCGVNVGAFYTEHANVEMYTVDLTEAARAGNLPAEWLADVVKGFKLPSNSHGYRILYVTNEGDVLCSQCATYACTGEVTSTEKSIDHGPFHEGPPEHCAGCDVEIESDYGDPDAPGSEVKP